MRIFKVVEKLPRVCFAWTGELAGDTGGSDKRVGVIEVGVTSEPADVRDGDSIDIDDESETLAVITDIEEKAVGRLELSVAVALEGEAVVEVSVLVDAIPVPVLPNALLGIVVEVLAPVEAIVLMLLAVLSGAGGAILLVLNITLPSVIGSINSLPVPQHVLF